MTTFEEVTQFIDKSDAMIDIFKELDVSPADAMSICAITMIRIIMEIKDMDENEAFEEIFDSFKGMRETIKHAFSKTQQ